MQQLWAQHKYSVMARSPEEARRIGRDLAAMGRRAALPDLARNLVLILREAPTEGRLANAVEHMWGHVNKRATPQEASRAATGVAEMLGLTQELALKHKEKYLLESTALSDLAVFTALK